MFDLGRDEEIYYITMEYVPGQVLKGLIRQNRETHRRDNPFHRQTSV